MTIKISSRRSWCAHRENDNNNHEIWNALARWFTFGRHSFSYVLLPGWDRGSPILDTYKFPCTNYCEPFTFHQPIHIYAATSEFTIEKFRNDPKQARPTIKMIVDWLCFANLRCAWCGRVATSLISINKYCVLLFVFVFRLFLFFKWRSDATESAQCPTHL